MCRDVPGLLPLTCLAQRVVLHGHTAASGSSESEAGSGGQRPVSDLGRAPWLSNLAAHSKTELKNLVPDHKAVIPLAWAAARTLVVTAPRMRLPEARRLGPPRPGALWGPRSASGPANRVSFTEGRSGAGVAVIVAERQAHRGRARELSLHRC